ncbi:MAG: TatD family hydrolase [Candidatus Thermoplasmatota archaeon]|nr:TatD family hydrolase [Candidatus Thermoplasmatota archaeon]
MGSSVVPGAFDAHFHLNLGEQGKVAVKRYMASGGSGINLVNLPDYYSGYSGYYEKRYELTIKLAEMARESGLRVSVTLGPYPLDYFFWEKGGFDAKQMMLDGVELAAKYCREHRATAIGEIGRPHFPVEQKITEESNEIMMRCMQISKEIGCAVVLHTEDLDSSGMEGIHSMAVKAGADLRKIVKHHASPEVNHVHPEISRSILATRDNVRKAINEKTWNFMLESDYVDDPAKPDKVIPPDSVPKRAIMIKEQYQNNDEIFAAIFRDLPEYVFSL